MTYTDIFHPLETPANIPKDPRGLLKHGLAIMDLAQNARLRSKYHIEKELPITSSDGAFAYPIVSWNRRVGRRDVYMNIVDKRANKAGLLLTARAGSERPGVEVVKIFVVNDNIANRGLTRAINHGYPEDVANQEIDNWHRSAVPWAVDTSPSPAQRIDYAKAISTAYI